jgi:hypothetical protein
MRHSKDVFDPSTGVLHMDQQVNRSMQTLGARAHTQVRLEDGTTQWLDHPKHGSILVHPPGSTVVHLLDDGQAVAKKLIFFPGNDHFEFGEYWMSHTHAKKPDAIINGLPVKLALRTIEPPSPANPLRAKRRARS